MRACALAALVLPAAACVSEPGRPACAPARALTELTPVGDDDSPWLTNDRTELFFNAKSPGGYGLYRARRSADSGNFGAAVLIEDDPSGNDDFDATLSSNALTFWFVNGSGMGGGFIYEGSRGSTSEDFTNEHGVFLELTARYPLLHPTFTSDRLQVFYAQSQGADFDIYWATRTSATGTFDSIKAVSGVNTTFDEKGPTISADGSILYFSSPRFGDAVDQASQTAHLGFATAASGFTDPRPIANLGNVEGKEDDLGWVAPDGSTVVFASSRPGGADSIGNSLWIACE